MACSQVAGDKGVLELFDFVIPMREGEAAYRLRDAAFLAELDIAVTQRTTEHVVRLGLLQGLGFWDQGLTAKVSRRVITSSASTGVSSRTM